MNKQRKTIVVVLGVAMLALVVDRVFLQESAGPRKAGADTSVAPTSSATPLVQQPTAPHANEQGVVLARRLEQLQQSEQFNLSAVRNAFEPDKSWIQPKIEIKRHGKQGETRQATLDPVQNFIESHRLTAVLGVGESGAAIVEGERWPINKTINGWTLTTITIRTAVFEKDGKQAVLQIAKPEIPKKNKDKDAK